MLSEYFLSLIMYTYTYTQHNMYTYTYTQHNMYTYTYT